MAAVVGVLAYLYDNLISNLAARGIPTDFDFLDRPATIEIAYSDFRASQPVRDAILVGVKNTLLVASVGIVLTLVLGTLVGVARLSTNVLVRSAAGFYVETLRNLPPLLVIVFVNSAVFLELPVIGDPIDLGVPAVVQPGAGRGVARARATRRVCTCSWSRPASWRRRSCGAGAPG